MNDQDAKPIRELIGLDALPPRNGGTAEALEDSPAARFGAWVLTQRRCRGLSIAGAAARAACPPTQWRAVEYGVLSLDETGECVPALSRALGIPAARLYIVLFAFIAGEEPPPIP